MNRKKFKMKTPDRLFIHEEDLKTYNEKCGLSGLRSVAVGDPHTEYVRADLVAWQPIETAPEGGSTILGLTSCGVEVVKYCCEYDVSAEEAREGWIGLEVDSACKPAIDELFRSVKATTQPTHWMPLPATPKGI